MSQYDELLNKVINDVTSSIDNSLSTHCIFDLDSTLFNVTSRTEKILLELIAEDYFTKNFFSEISKLSLPLVNHDDWGIKQALVRAGIENPLFFNEAKKYWTHKFFSNDYLKYDVPYDGAVDFVNHIYNLGVHITYLTGRDQVRMHEGTLLSLQQWKFPILKNNTYLALKPQAADKDNKFKCDYIKKMTPKFQKMYFFENEPLIIHDVEKFLPQVQIIFMDSVHSGRAEALDHWPRIKMTYKK